MKKGIIILSILVSSFMGARAQSTDAYFDLIYSVLKTEKRATVTQVMELTDEEKQPFWELYDKYELELSKLQSAKIEAIKLYDTKHNELNLETAEEIWTSIMNAQIKIAKVEKKYYKQFKKILPTEKAIRFLQTENKIKAMLSAKLANQVPLLETNQEY
ncbi:hypothetical protein [Saccharicrinis aurantiacus]|uniref:hypothetical protein n=1 Tax=Saccharicrinis aurantiacus TaxID=1849719 RepID=UPI00248FC256|nr:hypothetical protein [Saccharicrinis aurantiacus]